MVIDYCLLIIGYWLLGLEFWLMVAFQSSFDIRIHYTIVMAGPHFWSSLRIRICFVFNVRYQISFNVILVSERYMYEEWRCKKRREIEKYGKK